MTLPQQQCFPFSLESHFFCAVVVVQKPIGFFLHTMDVKALHFGYLISKETFSVLWKQEDVSVRFDLRKRKWFFFLSHLSESYKLEISFDSIWQIKLHRPRGQTSKFLLIQVNLLNL
jgi:RNA-dependent RNA polymerase